MLGAGSVTGFDIDEEALETAAENIQVRIFFWFFLCFQVWLSIWNRFECTSTSG